MTVVDLSRSPAYRKGHIPGAWFAIRTRLAQALAKIPMNGELVLTSEDGVLAGLAVEEARALAKSRCAFSRAAMRPGPPPDSALDRRQNGRRAARYWPKPYERAGDPKDAMNEYLSWEVDLLTRIARDGTTHFSAPPR